MAINSIEEAVSEPDANKTPYACMLDFHRERDTDETSPGLLGANACRRTGPWQSWLDTTKQGTREFLNDESNPLTRLRQKE